MRHLSICCREYQMQVQMATVCGVATQIRSVVNVLIEAGFGLKLRPT
jgi:hypothetical protein